MWRIFKSIFVAILSFERSCLQNLKCKIFSDQFCSFRPTPAVFNPYEVRWYAFTDICNGSKITLDDDPYAMNVDLSDRILEHLNVKLLNIIKWFNKPKSSVRNISSDIKFRFDGKKFSLNLK